MHIQAVMCQTPTNKSQKDEEGGEEGSDRGAYHDPGNTSVARMPQEILVLLGGRVVSLVGHGHWNFRSGYDFGYTLAVVSQVLGFICPPRSYRSESLMNFI